MFADTRNKCVLPEITKKTENKKKAEFTPNNEKLCNKSDIPKLNLNPVL